ncbi:MAG: TlpA family protein disulfide reductase [Deltaproteobacteria bacterium]|nr:TlpA family protein disulfide reductase [Deltaproteobacteria bacterium]
MADNNVTEEGGGLPKIAVVGIVAVVVIVVAIIILSGRKKYEPVNAGLAPIDFTLPGLDGRQVSLKDFRGKVIFLNFWATTCKPCEEEMPSMQKLYDALKGRPFEIVAVSIDTGDISVVREFAKKYGLTFTILHDRSGAIKEAYKTTGVPETFIIDQNFVIAEKVWGARDWSQRSSVDMILGLLQYGPKPRDAYKPLKAV